MNQAKSENKLKETTRVEAFSDGVFAFAITLLVLELIGTLNPDANEKLLDTCIHHWQSFLAFIIGFITLLVCWINHHIALEYIKKVDTRFMWINGFLLFLITFTPFPTAILAKYLQKEGGIAVAIYGFNYFLIAIASDRICTYAYNHHLIDNQQREFYRSYKMIYRFSIFYTFIAFLTCFVSIVIPIILYAILFVMFAAPKEFASWLHKFRTKKKISKTKSA